MTATQTRTLPRIDPDPLSPLNQMQRYLVHEFVEDYRDGLLSRRDLVAKIGHIAGGAAAAAAILTMFGVSTDEVSAQEATPATTPLPAQSSFSVSADDPAVATSLITFQSGGVSYTGYEARPSGGANAEATPATVGTPVAGNGGLVLVCHENRGLTEHIRDVTRRLAVAGYVGLAVDLLSPEGGTDKVADPSEIPALLTEGDMMRHVAAFKDAVLRYDAAGDPATAALGMIGFCFGGGITWRTVTQEPRLLAAVPFYGPPPPLDDVPNTTAAVLGVYSADPGDFANEGRDELAAALAAAGVTHEIRVYPGTEHAFHNDTGPRFNEEQATAAWEDTLAWLGQYLGAVSS